MSDYEVLMDILYRALTRYDREAARLRRNRQDLSSIAGAPVGPTIERGTRRSALARYLASEIIRERPQYDPAPSSEKGAAVQGEEPK